MEARSLISCPSRAIVKYGQNALIHHTPAARVSLFPSSIPIACPLRLRRELSNSSPSSSQATAAAEQSPAQHKPNQKQQPRQQRQHPFFARREAGRPSSGEKLHDVTGLLDLLQVDKDGRSQSAADRSSIDKKQGDEVSSLLQRSRQDVTGDRSWKRNLTARNLSATTAGPELNLGPRLGRSIPVRGRDSLKEAVSNLGKRVANNRVRQDVSAQRFHVRRGQLKKDLKSQRWRRLFKKSFQATVDRCEKLRRQGW